MNPASSRHVASVCAVLLLAGCSGIIREEEGYVHAEELDEAPEHFIEWEDVPEEERPGVLVTVMEEAVHGPGLRGTEVVPQDQADEVDALLRSQPGYREEWAHGVYFMKYNSTFFEIRTGHIAA